MTLAGQRSTLNQIIECLEIGDELFWEPSRQVIPGVWTGHLAIAFWLIKAARPAMFVELGTHSGNSYAAFCQAIAQMGLATRAFAVDTWRGDEHSGLYGEEVFRALQAFNESHFGAFSKLLRTTFDEARGYFPDSSVDLLHIDGLHTYEAVKHDFETWKSALSPDAVVVFHDTNVREREFRVWKLWQELAEIYPSFEFHHSEGLGVLGVGESQPRLLRRLFELGRQPQSAATVRGIFASRGEAFVSRSQVLDLAERFASVSTELQKQSHSVSALEQDVASRDATLREREQQLESRSATLLDREHEIRAKAGLISNLQQELIGRDAALAEREQEIRAKADLISNLQQELVGRDAALAEHEQEIRAKANLISNLQQELVSRDATLRDRELTIASRDGILRAKKWKIEELDESATYLREQLLEATHRLDAERSATSERIELLQQELASVQHTLGLVESSTAWKLASRLRSAFQSYPRVRLYTRRLARLIWWTITFQLLDRIRSRRRLFKMRDMIAHSTLFDAAWYVSQYPSIAEAGCDPALHYALYGATKRRNPGPRFDAEAYLLRNPEVAEAGANPLIHYLEHGASEGRVISSVDAPPVAAQAPAEVPRHDYQNWVSCYDTINDDDRAAILRHIELLRDRPLISIVMPVYNTDPAFLCKALDSVLSQLYPDWELCIADDASSRPEIRTILDEYARRDRRIKLVYRNENGHISAASNSALEMAKGTFIAPMNHDDELRPHALYMVAVTINEHPETDIIYSDEDKIDADGVRQTPYFKPDWNAELFYSQNYLGHLGIYRASLVLEVGGFREGYEGSQDYDLALRIVAVTSPDRIRHIPHVLYHWRTAARVQTFSIDNLPTAVRASRRALADYFAERGEDLRVTGGKLPQFNRVIRHLPDAPPSISVIIPTRDRVSLLRGCVDGLLHHTAYDNFEIIIIDNDSCEMETIEYLTGLQMESKVRVLRSEGEFNYSALNNRAVCEAKGDLIGFLNNDIEVIHPEWLYEMVTQVMQPGVGAVGAKLYYPDNTIQHAGVILGLGGVAGHSHLRLPRSDAGYFDRLQLVHEVSCVTGACMLMHKAIFLEVGGFDETALKIAFNDVDLCLKLRKAGYRIIWTPYAELYHLESASRGYDFDPVRVERISGETAVMIERWGKALEEDPFYNPNLSLVTSENHKPAFPPRVQKAWRSPFRTSTNGDQQAGGVWNDIAAST
jgi:GT2 family glycosyltransferase